MLGVWWLVPTATSPAGWHRGDEGGRWLTAPRWHLHPAVPQLRVSPPDSPGTVRLVLAVTTCM